jgi:DNA polymerase-3 subunit gamma/tau
MSSANLTAKYRPQTFASVAGQESVKAILSRAALEDKVAPAYLFSGTRGVGKTTIARIFAKAVNCLTAPTAEPCNQCAHCRQITAGAAVDVVEIDGASNRGIDEARRLKEDIGYAPIECRYKVFIIDEAHMLTKEAFNALLKTLEEPPRHTTFILATTEPHKFPATIISRCQHYVFKRLTQQGLLVHLEGVLGREGVPYEMGAVNLIAKRGAGSVRDSMSLLGQVLALGGASLTEADVRQVLGLAGQEAFLTLVTAVRDQDLDGLCRLTRGILDQGLDIGFFLKELAACWRNLFLLKEAKNLSLDLLDLTEDEAASWRELAVSLDLTQIHASWQMTLEGRQRVLKSLEPGLALELLLLNLAYLPRLIPLREAGSGGQGGGMGSAPGGRGGPGPGSGPGGGAGGRQPGGYPPSSGGRPGPGYGASGPTGPTGPAGPSAPSEDFTPSSRPAPPAAPASQPVAPVSSRAATPAQSPAEAPASAADRDISGMESPRSAPASAPDAPLSAPSPAVSSAPSPASPPDASAPAPAGGLAQPPSFEEFWSYLRGKVATGECKLTLNGATGGFEGDTLVVTCSNAFQAERMDPAVLGRALQEMTGREFRVDVRQRAGAVTKSHGELAREAEAHPLVRQLVQEFQAHVGDVEPLRAGNGAEKP